MVKGPERLYLIAVRMAEKLDYRQISNMKAEYYSMFIY